MTKLSERENEVVDLLLQGKSNKMIALSLGISDRTVEFHLKNVYVKFQVSSRVELILKLGNTTGNTMTEKLGYSTVDKWGENTENRDEYSFLSFRDTISITGKESQMEKHREINITKRDIIVIVIGCICFGATMALRDIIPNIWMRAIIAAIAFIFMGFTITRLVRGISKQKVI